LTFDPQTGRWEPTAEGQTHSELSEDNMDDVDNLFHPRYVWQRDTETKRQRDTETKRHRDKETKRHRDTETKRHRDTETKRQRDTETQRHRDTDSNVFISLSSIFLSLFSI